jgi:hypothetical protein
MAASKSRSRSSSSSSKSSSSSSRARSGGGGGGGSSRGGSAQVTQDHDEIRKWAEARGGKPACVRGTERGNSCLLRIDFPGGAGADQLAPMQWEEFFEQFDKNGLAFLYQDKGQSRFNKFVTPETAGVKGSRKGASAGGTRGGGGRGGNGRGNMRGGGGGNSKSSSRARGGSGTRSSGTRSGGSTRGGGGRKGKAASGGTRGKRTARRGAVIIPIVAVLALLGAIVAAHPALVSFR